MAKFTDLIERFLLPLAQKLSENRYLKAISSGFSTLLPITILGAIGTLLANLNIAPYQSLITLLHLKPIISFIPTVTTDMLALYTVYLVGRSLAQNFEIEEYDIVGMLSLFTFLLLIPLGVSGTKDNVTVQVAAALGTTYLGAAGLFSAMILGLVVPVIYRFFVSRNIVIRMPASVPPMISRSFKAILPAFGIGIIFSVVRYLFSFTSYGSANAFIYSMLKAPLSALGASPVTFIILILMCSLMWFFGLHGGMIVMPFINILYQGAGLENLAAYAAGEPMPNMLVKAWWSLFASLGGAGGTVGFCLLMFFMAKSQRYKTLGKLALPAGLCGINEPITFGVPVVLNTLMLIPLLITPVITFGLTYLLTSIGILPYLNGTDIPLGTPIIFSGMLCGGWRVAVWQIVLVAIQTGIYFPFFKVLDEQALKDEQV